jgi:hypothetical protein
MRNSCNIFLRMLTEENFGDLVVEVKPSLKYNLKE